MKNSNLMWALCCVVCCCLCFFLGTNAATPDCSECPNLTESAYLAPVPLSDMPMADLRSWVTDNCSIISCSSGNYICINDTNGECNLVSCPVSRTCDSSCPDLDCTRHIPLE